MSARVNSAAKWLSGANALLGLWMIVSVFIYAVTGATFWNAIVVGALVAIFGGYNVFAGSETTEEATTPTA